VCSSFSIYTLQYLNTSTNNVLIQLRYQDVSTTDEYEFYLKEEDTGKTSLLI
jgi:hypothetical protein